MASQVSLPGTPQNNATYENYMHSLQQKLSSISMQNASTLGPLSPQSTLIGMETSKTVFPNVDSTTQVTNKLHIDSSGPSSGTTTTEMLSPVRDETTPTTTDLSKPKNLTALNNELSKINARRDSTIVNILGDKSNGDNAKVDKAEHIKSPSRVPSDTKIRKVSRFKVSAVTEPDQSKLIIPNEHKLENKIEDASNMQNKSSSIHTTPVKSKTSIKEDVVEPEDMTNELKIAKDIISSTMQHLKENLSTFSSQQVQNLHDYGGQPSNANPHAELVNPTTIIGITVPNTIARKNSVIVDKNKTTQPLKKSLSYNDLATEIANLFSKPKKISSLATKTTPTIASVNNTNPRKTSGSRRPSKTFRRTPTIIIHPPDENLDRFTNSCPDIQALLTQENKQHIILPNDSDLLKSEMNYSCPDINALTEISRSPSPNLSKYNSNFSRSCPDINALLEVKNKNIHTDSYNDLANSCPNINDMRNNYIQGMPKKRASSSESTDNFEDSFDSFEKSLDRYDEYYKKSNSSKVLGNFSPFAKCIYELDMLKNEVNDIKNECECLLYECTCQQSRSNLINTKDDFKMVHYNTPLQRNTFKILPTKNIENSEKNKRINRKISFSKLPYSPRSNELLNVSYNKTISEPNLLKNVTQFRSYNRSCSDVGDTISKQNNYTHILSNEYLENYDKHFKINQQKFNDSYEMLRPNSLNINNYKSSDSLDTLGKSNTNSVPHKQKIIKKSPKKHDISPTDILRNKMKQSLSMFDLNASKSEENYDNYHTIHGGMKFPKDLTDFSLKNYKNQSENLNTSWTEQKNEIPNNENLLAIAKCCCGDPNCQNGRLQVVPITFQQLLDSNLSSHMNETLEEMLSRQQAELNALIDAHKRQQIEYMKSITDISKPSGSKKEC